MIEDFRGHAPYPAGDVADGVNGVHFSGNTIGPAMISMDMRTLGLDMPVPFFIVQGRDDHITGFEPARLYAEDVRAPKKAFVPMEGGHYACFTNPGAFVSALREQVRPLAI
jgi:pimeloyl-ACP methyl ester carboxylesterase